MEKINLIGRKYRAHERKILLEKLIKFQNREVIIEGEINPSREDLAMLDYVNNLLRTLPVNVHRLENEGFLYDPLPINRLHLLPELVFKDVVHQDQKDANALFYPEMDMVLIKRPKKMGPLKKTRFFISIMHELVHRASVMSFYTNKNGRMSNSRVGYHFSPEWKQRGEGLAMLNEYLVVVCVYQLINYNIKSLEEKFGINLKRLNKKRMHSYMEYKNLFTKMFKGIASKYTSEDEKGLGEVYDSFLLGLFSRRYAMQSMRWIIGVYGRNAIKILNLLDSKKNSTHQNVLLRKQVEDFFSEIDISKRKKIEDLILGLKG